MLLNYIIGAAVEVVEPCEGCLPDHPCDGILSDCEPPNCQTGEVPVIPEGQCCPVCVRLEEEHSPIRLDPCESVVCQQGTCQVISGRAVCLNAIA